MTFLQRVFVGFVSLLYMSVAIVFGAVHHHHQATTHADGCDDNCAACHWQLHANTDVPVVQVMPVVLNLVYQPLLIPSSFPTEAPFLPDSASRAPPPRWA